MPVRGYVDETNWDIKISPKCEDPTIQEAGMKIKKWAENIPAGMQCDRVPSLLLPCLLVPNGQ